MQFAVDNKNTRLCKDIFGNIYDVYHIPKGAIFQNLDLSGMDFAELPASLATCAVLGKFNCSYCVNLTSLKNLPQGFKVLDCSNCWSLTSLRGIPESVSMVICHDCRSLPTLIGLPPKLRSLDCRGCRSLPDFNGCNSEMLEEVLCSSCFSISSLRGIFSKRLRRIDFGLRPPVNLVEIPEHIPSEVVLGISPGEIAFHKACWGLNRELEKIKAKAIALFTKGAEKVNAR